MLPKRLFAFVGKQWMLLLSWSLLPLINFFHEFFRDRYNNYKIFRQVFYHIVNRQNLYNYYPTEYFDSNHYGPIFFFLIAPFAVLPDYLGSPLWNLANALFLYWVLNQLPLPRRDRMRIILLCTIEMANAMWSNQFNSIAAAMIVLNYILVQKGKDFWACFVLFLGFYIKLYGIIGLFLFLFSENKKNFILYGLFWAALLFLLPMLVAPPAYIWQTYQDWFHCIVDKNNLNISLESSQDTCIPGMCRRYFRDPSISNLPFIVSGALLFLAPLIRIDQYKHKQFQLLMLASALMFIILFSSSSEHPTYIYPMIGVALWYDYRLKLKPGWWVHVLIALVIIFGGLGPTDILTKAFRTYMIDHALKALPYSIAWFLLLYDLLMRDFNEVGDPLMKPEKPAPCSNESM